VVFILLFHNVLSSNEIGKNFLAENAKKSDVISLPSGLQYKIIQAGTGKDHPTLSSPCDCHYRGKLVDGTEFDSSYKRGKPATFAPNQVIKGWTEAMQLMVEGDRWELYIPSDLAYGESQRGQYIIPGSVLIFQLELIKINGPKVPKEEL